MIQNFWILFFSYVELIWIKIYLLRLLLNNEQSPCYMYSLSEITQLILDLPHSGVFFIVPFLLLLFWCFWFFFLSHTPFIICYSTGLEFKTNIRNKSKNLSLLILVLLYIIKIRTISIVWFYCSRHLSISYGLYFFHSILWGC